MRLLVFLFFASLIPAQAAALPGELTRALREAQIPLDAVAFIIQPVDAKNPALAHRPELAMNPASVMKVLTSVVALEKLGPAYVWKTEVWAVGEVKHRTLYGDLVIKGYGDPTLTLERLWLLQREIKSRGIDAIQGHLILDTRHFDLPVMDAGLFDGEPLAAYNALPGALLTNYNVATFKLNVVGDAVSITSDLNLPELTLTSQVVPDDAGCGDWKERLGPIRLEATRQELVFEGRYARDCGEKQLNLNVYEPAHHFGATFRALWKESGGELTGGTLFGAAPSDIPAMISFPSIPLAEALRNLNKFSNNLMTRNVFLTLGVAHGGAPATLEKSSQAISVWLAENNIAAPELVLENGAGLSRIERISARTLGRVLQAAHASPFFSELESALPIVAVDGTLRRRFTDTPFASRAHLKSGTLQDVRALAGYIFNRDGKRMIFVMLVNHAHAEHAELAQRALLTWAYHYRKPLRAQRSLKQHRKK